MQILRPRPSPPESEPLAVGPSDLGFMGSPGDSHALGHHTSLCAGSLVGSEGGKGVDHSLGGFLSHQQCIPSEFQPAFLRVEFNAGLSVKQNEYMCNWINQRECTCTHSHIR